MNCGFSMLRLGSAQVLDFGLGTNSTARIFGMDLFTLKTPRFPVSGAAASMSDGDDLDGRCYLPVNDGVGKTPEEKLSGPVQVRRPTFWTFGNLTNGLIERCYESRRRGRIALNIPPISSSCLSYGFRMEFNAWRSHRTARGSGDAPQTMGPPLPLPDLNRRCAALSPDPTPLQHLHPPSHPGFQLDIPQVRLALQQVNGELLPRPFYDPDSSEQFYISSFRQHKCQLSEAGWLIN